MTDLLKQSNAHLQRQNDRLIDVIVGVVCVFGGFAVGVYSFVWGWL